jgi:hypothetical protein
MDVLPADENEDDKDVDDADGVGTLGLPCTRPPFDTVLHPSITILPVACVHSDSVDDVDTAQRHSIITQIAQLTDCYTGRYTL